MSSPRKESTLHKKWFRRSFKDVVTVTKQVSAYDMACNFLNHQGFKHDEILIATGAYLSTTVVTVFYLADKEAVYEEEG